MQLPPDFGTLLKNRKSNGTSDSLDEDNITELESLASRAPANIPAAPSTFQYKETPPAVIPENDERARLLALIEQSKKDSDLGLASAKAEQEKKDNMAAILGGVNIFSSGLASKNAGSTINVDSTFNDKLIADGKAGVEGAKTSRESKLKDLLGNYDRYREGAKDQRDLASDKRLLVNDKFDRIYKQKQLEVSAANSAATRELASETRAANRDLKERALKIREGNEQEKDDVLTIPGYERTSGRITSEEAKQTRGAIASVGELKDLLAQYKTAIGKEGTFELFGEGSERLKKLTKGIQRAMGRANEFGVIQAGELPMLEQMSTYDPESTRALFTKNSTAAAGIDQIVENLNSKMSNKVESIGYRPKNGTSSDVNDSRIDSFMKANDITNKDEAVKILKKQGLL